MDDLTHVFLNALNAVGPRLLADPAELRRRLDRRKNRHFLRPFRSTCLSLRASDLRINDCNFIIVPRTALSLESLANPGRYAEHQIILTKEAIAPLVAPVRICPPGEPADHVARKLGCRPDDLMSLRRSGALSTTLKPGLMGRHGHPVPLIYTPDDLDPQALRKAGGDDIFAGQWRWNINLMPEGFRQTLTRIPRYKLIQRRNTFQGWSWLCPCCRKTARIIYYPVGCYDFCTWIGFAPALSEPLPKPTPIFACANCHGILNFSRSNLRTSWNLFVLQSTGGLLFGREVQKPAWLKQARKRAYHPQHNPRPALSLQRIQNLLVTTDLSFAGIARELHLTRNTVGAKTAQIYKRNNVPDRDALRQKLSPPQPQQQPLAAAG